MKLDKKGEKQKGKGQLATRLGAEIACHMP